MKRFEVEQATEQLIEAMAGEDVQASDSMSRGSCAPQKLCIIALNSLELIY